MVITFAWESVARGGGGAVSYKWGVYLITQPIPGIQICLEED
jgi:hypothetical protein